jgi:toxin ParE1/3/4
MPGVVKQIEAERDLVDIWLYTFNEWGELQADKYMDELAVAMNLLSQQPFICRERSEFTPPVRIQHHGHHLIVYMAQDNGISVIRVLHENMDVDGQLE